MEELIAGVSKSRPLNMDILEQIVREDEKTRYSFNEDKTMIRANQRHSILVDIEFDRLSPPNALFHGTGEKYVSFIEEQGLISKSRLYVHLSADVDTAIQVGMRHGKHVVYRILAEQMERDGFAFFLFRQ